MTLRTGLYRATFSTPLGHGSGVVVLENGKVTGGDSGFAFVGNYNEIGDKFSADVRIFKHTHDQLGFALLGSDDATVVIEGKVDGDKMAGFGNHSTLQVDLELLQAA